MTKGLLANAESRLTGPAVPWQVAASGVGELRLTSFWGRQASGVPSAATCVTCPELVAAESPLTPSQPPNRLSKLWFSS